MPPVTDNACSAVKLATNLKRGQMEGQGNREMYKQGKTSKYLWAGDVAAGVADFPASYLSTPTGIQQFPLKGSAFRICPSSDAQTLGSVPIESQGLSFLKGKAQHSLQLINHGGFVLQSANSKDLFSRKASFNCLSKI